MVHTSFEHKDFAATLVACIASVAFASELVAITASETTTQPQIFAGLTHKAFCCSQYVKGNTFCILF